MRRSAPTGRRYRSGTTTAAASGPPAGPAAPAAAPALPGLLPYRAFRLPVMYFPSRKYMTDPRTASPARPAAARAGRDAVAEAICATCGVEPEPRRRRARSALTSGGTFRHGECPAWCRDALGGYVSAAHLSRAPHPARSLPRRSRKETATQDPRRDRPLTRARVCGPSLHSTESGAPTREPAIRAAGRRPATPSPGRRRTARTEAGYGGSARAG